MNDHRAGGLFSQTVSRLAAAGLHAPPLAQRRAKYNAEERLLRNLHGNSLLKPREPASLDA